MIIVYCILGILLFPFALVFYVPCAAAYKGGKIVNDCLVSWHLQSKAQTLQVNDVDSDDNYICSNRATIDNARIKCCSCFNFGRVIAVGFVGLLCFALGAVVNCIVAPAFLILLLLCLPCYLIHDTINKRREVIDQSNSTLERFGYMEPSTALRQTGQ